MKKFAVYQKNLDDLVFVQEDLNITAGILNIFWAIYNKIWPMVIIGLIIYTVDFAIYKKQFSIIMSSLNFLVFSLLSDFIYSFYLEKKGFVLADVIIADNRKSAEIKFLERNK